MSSGAAFRPAWMAAAVFKTDTALRYHARQHCDDADVCTVLRLAAADLYAVMAGYAGAGAADLTDGTFPPDVAMFLAAVLDSSAPMAAELLPGWGEAMSAALERQ